MTDDTVAVSLQMARFLCVGAVGYVVNLAVHAGCVHVAAVDHRASAVAACTLAPATTSVLGQRLRAFARPASA